MEGSISNTRPAVHFGRDLAYELRNKSAAQRAVLAAEDGDGPLYIFKPTNAQRAGFFKISIPTLTAARALPPAERERVKRGERPLIEPQDRLKAAISVIDTDDHAVGVLIEMIGFDGIMGALDRLTAPSPVLEAAE